MNTVQDAYQPPVNQPRGSKIWFRLAVLSVLLAITLAITVVAGTRLARDARVREMNSNRRPVLDRIPNPIPDGSGID